MSRMQENGADQYHSHSNRPRLSLLIPAVGVPCGIVAYALFLIGQYLAAGAPIWAFFVVALWLGRAALFVHHVRESRDTPWDVAFVLLSFTAALACIVFFHLARAA